MDTFQEAVAPVSIVLALDASGSMTKAADGVKAAALSFVEALRPEDALSVLLFSDTSAFAHDLTTDRQQSIAAVNAYNARGGTALYDGLTDALMRLKQTEGRKVVVLLSDGRDEDNRRHGSRKRAHAERRLRRAQGDRRDDLSHRPRTARRSRAARAARCRVRRRWRTFPKTSRACASDYARIVEELRRRYVVSYTSTNAARDGAWRAVRDQDASARDCRQEPGRLFRAGEIVPVISSQMSAIAGATAGATNTIPHSTRVRPCRQWLDEPCLPGCLAGYHGATLPESRTLVRVGDACPSSRDSCGAAGESGRTIISCPIGVRVQW